MVLLSCALIGSAYVDTRRFVLIGGENEQGVKTVVQFHSDARVLHVSHSQAGERGYERIEKTSDILVGVERWMGKGRDVFEFRWLERALVCVRFVLCVLCVPWPTIHHTGAIGLLANTGVFESV